MSDAVEPHVRCWAEIDAAALRHNARVARELASPAQLLAIVKADAYGHGADTVVPAIEPHVGVFGVANVDEAAKLRTSRPILLLSPCLPAERELVVGRRFIPSLSTFAEIDGFAAAAASGRREPAPLPVHLVVDTGMGRIGFAPGRLAAALDHAAGLPAIEVTAISTHLPSADEDREFTRAQLAGFGELIERLGERRRGLAIHCLNSAGMLRFPRQARDLVRPGLQLYGVSPVPEHAGRMHPVMSVRTRVTLVRELPAGHGVSYGRTFITSRPTRVATLAIGYADGYPRALSGSGADVLVGGRRCPLLGRVTMDQIMVDVSALESVQPGAVATVLGRDGDCEISAAELAERAATIPWEILTGIQQRVLRIPLDSDGG